MAVEAAVAEARAAEVAAEAAAVAAQVKGRRGRGRIDETAGRPRWSR